MPVNGPCGEIGRDGYANATNGRGFVNESRE
jgi:hypothetical protein